MSQRIETEEDKLARELGEQRMRRALEQIEEAQNLLYEACGEGLSPIVGCVKIWQRAGKVAESVKALWYAVDGEMARLRTRGGPKVDRSHYAAELMRRRGASDAKDAAPSLAEFEAAAEEGRQLAEVGR